MSVDGQSRGRRSGSPRDEIPHDHGELKRVETRSAQSPSGNSNQITVNITDFGRKLHRIQKGDELVIAVCENGIWIPTDE